MTAATLEDPARGALRARIRRRIDLVVLVSAGLVGVLQLSAVAHTGSPRALIAALTCLALAGSSAAGRFGQARWTPLAYVAFLLAGNVAAQLIFGPLLGLGALYPCATAVASIFFPPRWRWALVAALTVTPLALGALIGAGVVTPPPPFDYTDVVGCVRIVVAVAASLFALAVTVRYAVKQLVNARVELEAAHAHELAARQERDHIEHEIGRARRADLIVEIAAEVGADIGAALAIVRARALALADELPGEAAQACLADVIAAASSAGSTMRSLTAFTPAASGEDERADAAQTARELPQIVRRVIPAHIALAIAADAPAWVPLGATDLGRILSNLVLNARDAIVDAGAASGTIEVRVASVGAEVQIAVRDDGAGMDAETRARVFQPFFTTKPVGRGTGLGLATARILVERAGGEIALESERGRGTCFTLTLPRADAR